MPKFVVYEVWTRSRVVNAKNMSDALRRYPPKPIKMGDGKNLSLCNWHAQVVRRSKGD